MKKLIILILILSLVVYNVSAAKVTGYFVVEPNATNNENNENSGVENEENTADITENEENKENIEIPPITGAAVKEQENNIFSYIKNFFVKIFSFFTK